MRKYRVLLLGGNEFPFHRVEDAGDHLDCFLDSSAFLLDSTVDRDSLFPQNVSEYDVVLDYMTDSRLDERQKNGLFSFVESGGGYVGLHCAANLTLTTDGRLDEPLPDMREFLGGYFVDHPSPGEITVKITDSAHPVTAGHSNFVVWDEPYAVECDDGRVLAQMEHPEIPDTPVVWTKTPGDGRVCYCSLGHTDEAFRNEGFQSLVTNAIRWAGDARADQ